MALSHFKLRDHIHASLLSRRSKVVAQEKTAAREGDTRGEREPPHPCVSPLRVSLARARSPFCPLLASACYAGYIHALDHCKTLKQTNKQQQSNKPTAATNNIAEEVACVCY